MQIPKRLQGNSNIQTLTIEVPVVIEREVKFGRKLFATSYNRETGEVVVKVDGLKFMEQEEKLQHKATSMYYYWEATLDLLTFLHTKFGTAVNLSPVVREVKAMQTRFNARSAQLAAKY